MKVPRRLVLNLIDERSPELQQVHFSHPLLGEERRAIRGKDGGAYKGYYAFSWSRAVKALTILLIEAKLRADDVSTPFPAPLLIGERRSLAASLDAAIDKQTEWLSAMFGNDASGRCLIRRILLRSNPSLKNPGPVSLALNTAFLPVASIEVFLGLHPLTPSQLGVIKLRIEATEETGLIQGLRPALRRVV